MPFADRSWSVCRRLATMEPTAEDLAAAGNGGEHDDPGVVEMTALLKKHYLEACVPRLR